MTFRHTPEHPENTWVLVADRARARIFNSAQWPPAAELAEVDDLIDDTALELASQTGTDRPTAFVSGGSVHHRGEPAQDYPHQTAERFARRIIERLEQARQGNKFGRLVVVAAPLMLGALRSELKAPLARLVSLEIDHDYSHLGPRELQQRLSAQVEA